MYEGKRSYNIHTVCTKFSVGLWGVCVISLERAVKYVYVSDQNGRDYSTILLFGVSQWIISMSTLNQSYDGTSTVFN